MPPPSLPSLVIANYLETTCILYHNTESMWLTPMIHISGIKIGKIQYRVSPILQKGGRCKHDSVISQTCGSQKDTIYYPDITSTLDKDINAKTDVNDGPPKIDIGTRTIIKQQRQENSILTVSLRDNNKRVKRKKEKRKREVKGNVMTAFNKDI